MFAYCLVGHRINFHIYYLVNRNGPHVVRRLVVPKRELVRAYLLAGRVVVEEDTSTSPERGTLAATTRARGTSRTFRISREAVVRSEDVAEDGGGSNNGHDKSER